MATGLSSRVTVNPSEVTWPGFGLSATHTDTQCGTAAYFCRVKLRLPVQLLILFWASRWFMPSVAMPSMDRTMSPTAMPPLTAFPPSVSCRNTQKSIDIRNLLVWSIRQEGREHSHCNYHRIYASVFVQTSWKTYIYYSRHMCTHTDYKARCVHVVYFASIIGIK